MLFQWQPVFEGPSGPLPPKEPGLLTNLMYNTYTVPCGVPMTNFWNKEDAAQMRRDFMKQMYLNDTFAETYIQCMQDMANAYETDNVLVTWGYDFAYWDASSTFGLIKDIMGYIQTRHGDIFDIKFSTVSDYLSAVKKEISEKQIKLQVFTDDFFPMEEI
jgi:hypothetical protein